MCQRGITLFYLPPIRLSTSGMNQTCLYFPAEHQRTFAATVLIFRPAQGRRLSWSEETKPNVKANNTGTRLQERTQVKVPNLNKTQT